MALYPDSMYDFPNVSAYDSDLREVLAMLRGVTHKMRDFEVVNKITNAGAWDITKQYKAWTIVSDNNIGYISVRPVPAGVEITNTDYWALVADYDILITNLSERITELNNKIDKRIVFVGDSYGEISGNFIDKAIARSKIAYGVNISAGSYGFLGDKLNFPLDDYSFEKLLRDNFSSIDSPEKITDVYVFGGVNDAYVVNESALLAAVESFCDYCAVVLPNAHVTIFLSSWTTNPTWLGNLEKVASVYSIGANKKAATFILGISASFHKKSLMRDAVHPTEAGLDYLANAVVDFIKNGNYHYYEIYNDFTSTLITDGEIDTEDSEYRRPTIRITEQNINIAGCLVVNKTSYGRGDWINIMYRDILSIANNDILIGNTSTDFWPSMGYTKIIATNNNTQIQPGSACVQNGVIYWASGCDSIDTQMDGKKIYFKYNITLPTAFN